MLKGSRRIKCNTFPQSLSYFMNYFYSLKRALTTVGIFSSMLLSYNLTAQTDSTLFAKKAKLQLISNQFAFTEGPAVDKEGNIYFTDQPNDKIWIYKIDGSLSLFMDKTGRANGLYFDAKGNLLACADEQNQLWRISPDKKVKILIETFEGRHLNGPNDLWVHPKSWIYFTDPHYKRSYWREGISYVKSQNVYFLSKQTGKPVIADSSLLQPNGIIGTADGKFLYVADLKDRKTYRYEIQKDGSLSNRTLFVSQGSDGMTIDNEGNVYLTGRGVTIYNSSGDKIGQIEVPAKWTANVCFGGKERNKLFITASESVFVLDMGVSGVQ